MDVFFRPIPSFWGGEPTSVWSWDVIPLALIQTRSSVNYLEVQADRFCNADLNGKISSGSGAELSPFLPLPPCHAGTGFFTLDVFLVPNRVFSLCPPLFLYPSMNIMLIFPGRTTRAAADPCRLVVLESFLRLFVFFCNQRRDPSVLCRNAPSLPHVFPAPKRARDVSS